MDVKEKVKLIYNALDDKKAEDITIIDIQGISVLADYFIVADANNQNQLTAMQDNVEEELHKKSIHASQVEGNRQSTWILLDFDDVIVHLFSKEDRLFYDLERIWQDGKKVNISEL
ncbi:MAG: ribosome silencing factor [Lachnospiraceae bacterium]|nr:ribosome silencing factor [Lachnospiraceae bacterium]